IMMHINALIAILVYIPFITLLLATNLAGGWLTRLRLANRAATGRITGFIGELFAAVQAIKVASAEERVVGDFRPLNVARRKAAVYDTTATQLLQSLNANMGAIGAGLVLLLLALQGRHTTFTLGDFALFVTYLSDLAGRMGWLGQALARQRQVGVSF